MTKSAKDRDRALAMAKPTEPDAEAEADADAAMEDAEETPTETAGSKVIVIHVGSQNLRIGLASDALPKTVPMVIARKSATNESEDHEEPKPKRLKRDDGSPEEPENLFGPEVRWRRTRRKSSVTISDPRTVVLSLQQNVSGSQSSHASKQAANATKLEGNGGKLQPKDYPRDHLRAQ